MNPITYPPMAFADNVVGIGQIPEGLLTAAYLLSPFSVNRKVYRLDFTGESMNAVEETSLAIATTANSWKPFGDNPIAADATLKAFDSTDNNWASNELPLQTFNQSNVLHGNVADCLRTTGYCRLVFGENANRTEWKHSNSPSATTRKFIRFELTSGGQTDSSIIACESSDIVEVRWKTDTAGTTSAPVQVSDVQILRREADRKWIDVTATNNGDTGANYIQSPDSVLPIIGMKLYMGFSSMPLALGEYLFRRDGDGVNFLTWKTETAGADTSVLPVTFTSANNHSADGPATTQTTAQYKRSAVSLPTGAVKRSLGDLSQEGGGTITTPSAWWLLFEVTAIPANISPRQRPVVRRRAELSGRADLFGVDFPEAQTIGGIQFAFLGTLAGSGSRTVRVIGSHAETADVRDVVIAAPASLGLGNRVALSSSISMAAGDKLLIEPVNGGFTCSEAFPILS